MERSNIEPVRAIGEAHLLVRPLGDYRCPPLISGGSDFQTSLPYELEVETVTIATFLAFLALSLGSAPNSVPGARRLARTAAVIGPRNFSSCAVGLSLNNLLLARLVRSGARSNTVVLCAGQRINISEIGLD